MSTTTLPELHVSTDPVRGRVERVTHSARRHARTIGVALWAAAGAVFAVHAAGLGLPDATRFAMLDAWLIGLGCVGCPLMALRDLEHRINLQVFAGVAVFCAALALLLTALILGSALHFNTLDGTFAVILPLAAAIQATNAVDAEVHARRREGRATRRGRFEVYARQFAQGHAALAGLNQLEEMTVDDLEELIDAAAMLVKEKRCEAHVLHLPSPAERRRARQRIDPA